jgi:hypothetical protein
MLPILWSFSVALPIPTLRLGDIERLIGPWEDGFLHDRQEFVLSPGVSIALGLRYQRTKRRTGWVRKGLPKRTA